MPKSCCKKQIGVHVRTSLTLQQTLYCKDGGLVIQRHNEIRDCFGDIAAQVWTQVVREPIVREAETQVGDMTQD